MPPSPGSPPPGSHFSFDALRRNVEAANLHAHDATDRLILDEATTSLAAAPAGTVAVVGDRYGALTLGAAALHGATALRTHSDVLTGERALAANAERLGLAGVFTCLGLAEVVAGARVVLLQLPRSLDELDALAAAIAAGADPTVRVFAGGRVKHMTHSMNDVLARHFDTVGAGRARQKSRVLVVSGPVPAERGPVVGRPARRYHADLDLTVCAHAGAFAGTSVDIGTRALLGVVDRMAPGARSAVDLGCGTGVLAVALARARPDLRVVATDESMVAVASAQATVDANGVNGRVTVVRDDAASSLPDGSVDLVVLNPPFHAGATVHPGIALRLFADAARVLRPGGELWAVWNSHLRYRPRLEGLVGPTRQADRNPKFTVTVSTRR